MKIPDKIYLDKFKITETGFILDAIVPDGRVEASDICYIRKDALLNKIDEVIAHLSDGSLTGYYESLAYKDIQELIESM